MQLKIEQSLSQRIIRNTVFNIIGRFWGVLVSLALTPYILHRIGIERFGMWAIVGVITGYFGLLDFGVGTSFVKYIAEFYTKRDYEKINQVVNTGFVFYSIAAVFIIALAFFIINPLINLFKIPAHLHNEALFVFLFGIVLFCISNALSSLGAIQAGLQRMDLTNKAAIAIAIPSIAGTIFFLEAGYGLPGLMVNNAIILVISSVVNLSIAFRIFPEIRFNPFLFNQEMFKKLFGFGYKLQVVKLSSLAGPQTDKLLITYFLSLDLVAFYQLGNLIVENAKSFSLLIISAILPAVSELHARGEMLKVKTLYLKAFRYVLLFIMPLTFFLLFNAHLTILTWMNQDFKEAVLVLQILILGFFINSLAGPGSLIVQGIGNPGYHARFSLAHLALNLFLSVILIIKFGFIGVLLGTSLSYFLTGAYFIYSVNRLLKVSFTELNKIIFPPLLACIPAVFFSYYAKFFLAPLGTGLSRLHNFSILLCAGIILGVVFLTTLLLMKYFDREDLALIKKTFLKL